MSRGDMATELDELGSFLRSRVTEASRMRWGDSGSTFRVALADGTIVAARLLVGQDSVERADELVRRSDLMAAWGISVARPARAASAGRGRTWLLTPWVDGVNGAMALDEPASALQLASQMGRMLHDVSALDGRELGAESDWARARALSQAGIRWLAALDGMLEPVTLAAARRALDDVVAGWDADAGWQVGVSHGDFAPINVVVTPGGDLVLLDLDEVQTGPRLLDIAWWGWVVRYHHPEVWARTWRAFVEATGLEPGARLDSSTRAVMLVRILERAARDPDSHVGSEWLRRLERCVAW